MRRLPGIAGILTAVLLAGCGVPTESAPRPIDPPVVFDSTDAPTAPASAPAGATVERLYLVRANQLVAVDRALDSPPDLSRQLADLLSGPTEQERASGVVSALAGTDLVMGARHSRRTAIVDVAKPSIRTDEVLAYGQIVCTLAARDDVDAVRFVQDGRALEVPRADGSLTAGPLAFADYQALIAVP
jgi:hypothetical protein